MPPRRPHEQPSSAAEQGWDPHVAELLVFEVEHGESCCLGGPPWASRRVLHCCEAGGVGGVGVRGATDSRISSNVRPA